MDVKYINPFLESIALIMPQLGFSKMEKKSVSVKDNNLHCDGVMILLGIVGDIKGNVIYGMDIDSAKKIASQMMMGMPVAELNELAQSALSELSNMITGNASTFFFNNGININISTPTLMYGPNYEVQIITKKILCIEMLIDDIPIDINIAFE